MSEAIEIDGAEGEGGGQVLRTSLGLSLVTGHAVHIRNVRAGRRKPGLLRQHLTALRAAATIGEAEVEGGELGSQDVHFTPRGLQGASYRFAVGSAGSATLVLQTVLPALLRAPTASELVIEGGTHNKSAPPFDFLERAFVPLLRRMGAQVDVALERAGFYPRGGGRFTVKITPTTLRPLELLTRGEVRLSAVARVAAIPGDVARRELNIVGAALAIDEALLFQESLDKRWGPGNVVFVQAEMQHGSEVFTAFGERGVSAEDVAQRAVIECQRWLAADVPVGEHLADQLLLLQALAGGGTFRTVSPSRHTRTQATIIERFLPVAVEFVDEGEDRCRVTLRAS